MLDWRRRSHRWSALVVTVETDDADRPVLRQEWVDSERLWPVRADPNRGSSAVLIWAAADCSIAVARVGSGYTPVPHQGH